MGVYYYYYLEKNIGADKWESIKYKGSDYFYFVRSYAHAFQDEYGAAFPMGFQFLNEEYKRENLSKYEEASEVDKYSICNFYLMDLERIRDDYNLGIHEYDGIISKNSFKKLQSNPEYNPKIIDEEVYAAFKEEIKENYMYYEWDLYYGECYYLYEIMPLVNSILEEHQLSIEDVRLLCRIS